MSMRKKGRFPPLLPGLAGDHNGRTGEIGTLRGVEYP
jgi:hypothetical protein